jgi:hypothetical protein
MSFETRCPQCVFLSRHLGRLTPCLLHVGTPSATQAPAPEAEPVAVAQEYDEPYEFGRLRPTVDCPGPFSLREYTRLLLLRSRVREARHAALAAMPGC